MRLAVYLSHGQCQFGMKGLDEGFEALLVVSIEGLEARAYARQHEYCLLFTTPGTGQSEASLLQSGSLTLSICLVRWTLT